MSAFDLIELNADDLRREPLEVHKATLVSVLAKAGPGRLNEHLEHQDGELVFRHACTGRSPDWLKMKKPDAPAVKREAATTRALAHDAR